MLESRQLRRKVRDVLCFFLALKPDHRLRGTRLERGEAELVSGPFVLLPWSEQRFLGRLFCAGIGVLGDGGTVENKTESRGSQGADTYASDICAERKKPTKSRVLCTVGLPASGTDRPGSRTLFPLNRRRLLSASSLCLLLGLRREKRRERD